jgi:hypothetical protein
MHWVSPQDKTAHNKKSFNILESLHVSNQDAHIVQVIIRINEYISLLIFIAR